MNSGLSWDTKGAQKRCSQGGLVVGDHSTEGGSLPDPAAQGVSFILSTQKGPTALLGPQRFPPVLESVPD